MNLHNWEIAKYIYLISSIIIIKSYNISKTKIIDFQWCPFIESVHAYYVVLSTKEISKS